MKNNMLAILRHVWMYVEEYCSIAAAILTLLLDYFGKWEGKTMPVLLGILAFIAYQLVKAKNKMTGVSDQAKYMLQELHGVQRQQGFDGVFFCNGTSVPEKEAKELGIVEEAQRELLVIQETGGKFVETSNRAVSECLARGVSVKIVVCATTQTTQSFLMLRNADLNNTTDFMNRHELFKRRLKTCLCNANGELDICKIQKLSLRYVPYPIDITGVMSDPENPGTAHCMIRFAGFRVAYEKKIDLEIFKTLSSKTFDYYRNQIELYRLLSYKKLLLIGPSRSGKTTVFQKMLDAIGDEGKNEIFWVLSQQITMNKKRRGFSVSYSTQPASTQFATLDEKYANDAHVGFEKYDLRLVENVWNKVAAAIRESPSRIFVIDEIGPMQARSKQFIDAVGDLVKNPKITVIATMSESWASNASLRQFGTDLAAELHVLTVPNRDDMASQFIKELQGALRLVRFEKQLNDQPRKA